MINIDLHIIICITVSYQYNILYFNLILEELESVMELVKWYKKSRALINILDLRKLNKGSIYPFIFVGMYNISKKQTNNINLNFQNCNNVICLKF